MRSLACKKGILFRWGKGRLFGKMWHINGLSFKISPMPIKDL